MPTAQTTQLVMGTLCFELEIDQNNAKSGLHLCSSASILPLCRKLGTKWRPSGYVQPLCRTCLRIAEQNATAQQPKGTEDDAGGVADRTNHASLHSRQIPIENCNDARCIAYTRRQKKNAARA